MYALGQGGPIKCLADAGSVGESALRKYLALFADGVGVNLGSLTSEFIVAAHDLGLAVHGWTFNQSTEEDALASQQAWIDAGMDGLFTNYTDLTRAIVDANVSAVPLPAGLPLMLAGVGSLAVIRRRRKAA